MARFNGDYKNEYAMLLMGECFRNSLTYFKGEVRDSNYFRPLLRMVDARTIEQAIYDLFGGEDLVKCEVALFCEKEGRDPHNGRKYGRPEMFYRRDDPEDTIQELWNNKERRERCRSLLFGIVDGFIATRTKAESARLAGIPSLAPGDFRTVRQSLFYLGGAVTNETRLNELEKESSLKKNAPRRIGF